MTNDPLRHAKAEINSAAESINLMMKSSSMETFERNWRNYLSCIEKSWVKTERACEPFRNKFQPWQGKYQSLRKKDMLLRYLKQARDADNHSIQDLADITPAMKLINFVNPMGGTIGRLEISGGKIKSYHGDPITVTERPAEPIAVRIKNNGEWYNPPTAHLGINIQSHHPVHLAQLGLDFYKDFIEKVDAEFFK